jgi:hypothetical protein
VGGKVGIREGKDSGGWVDRPGIGMALEDNNRVGRNRTRGEDMHRTKIGLIHHESVKYHSLDFSFSFGFRSRVASPRNGVDKSNRGKRVGLRCIRRHALPGTIIKVSNLSSSPRPRPSRSHSPPTSSSRAMLSRPRRVESCRLAAS